METEALLVCDSASDYNGKLCVLGSFDTVFVPAVPCLHPQCALVARLRFDRTEEGKHTFGIALIDADGRQAGPIIKGEVTVSLPPGRETVALNIIMNFTNLALNKAGVFYFDLLIDERLKTRVPLYVMMAPR